MRAGTGGLDAFTGHPRSGWDTWATADRGVRGRRRGHPSPPPPSPPPVPPPPDPDPVGVHFNDATVASGISYEHGYLRPTPASEPEEFGGGVASGDYDGDELVDLFVLRGDIGPNLLYRNLGDNAFEEVGEAAGVAIPNPPTRTTATVAPRSPMSTVTATSTCSSAESSTTLASCFAMKATVPSPTYPRGRESTRSSPGTPSPPPSATTIWTATWTCSSRIGEPPGLWASVSIPNTCGETTPRMA